MRKQYEKLPKNEFLSALKIGYIFAVAIMATRGR
jgi:hypothetical protein